MLNIFCDYVKIINFKIIRIFVWVELKMVWKGGGGVEVK